MNSKERVELFLKYQDEKMSFEDISKKLEIKPDTLRKTLNKHGYKSNKGIYEKSVDDSQLSFSELKSTNKKSKSNEKINDNKTKNINKNKKVVRKKESGDKKKKIVSKKDKKINITQDDMDKLCEVYDWYIQVRDNKSLKPKKLSNKKDISIEDENIKDFKSVNIRIDKETWEDFERLCSNSSFNKKEIITQALKDFMKTYKNLL
ncbi:DNA-binding protein [Terrisporobacter sp.]